MLSRDLPSVGNHMSFMSGKKDTPPHTYTPIILSLTTRVTFVNKIQLFRFLLEMKNIKADDMLSFRIIFTLCDEISSMPDFHKCCIDK